MSCCQSLQAGAAAFWSVVITLAVAPSASAQESRQPVFDAATRLKWQEQHVEMQKASSLKSTSWQFIGPELMCGRVTDIAVPHDKPFTYFVSTASGGVWKTTNEGTTWTPVFEDAPTGSTGTVAIAPSAPDTIWAGLGEANIFRSSMAGTGVYRSDDGGETWHHKGLEDTGHIARIVIDPADPNVVYVAASGHEYRNNPERGVYKSINGGESWEKVLFVAEHIGCIDLVMASDDPQTLYAAMWNRIRRPWSDPLPGADDGIFKSGDGGVTWERLSNGLPDMAQTGRIGLAISELQPDTLYAILDNHETVGGADGNQTDNYGRAQPDVARGAEVYRSDDAGGSWRLVSGEDRQMRRLFATYGWVFGQIRVAPDNPDTIFVMGVSLLKSNDGGKSFVNCGFEGLHADHHAMWIDPENPLHIVNGNDGGINISYDGGQTWKNVENLPVVQFYNVEVDNARPFRVYGSIQDNHSWRGPSDYRPGRSPRWLWEQIPGGEASTMAIDPNDENVFYSESFYGSLQRSTFEPPDTISIVPRAKEGEPPLRGQWLAPFLLSPHNSQVIYHGMQYVYRSMNRGESWERISDDLTNFDPAKQGNISYSTISALSESPLKFGLLYAGTDDGCLHVSGNGGESWSDIGSGLPRKWVSRVVASKFSEGTVYVTLNGKRDDDFQVYAYRSRDYGKNWEDLGAGIPGGPVNVIYEDPFYPEILYVGTDMSVYVTLDSGANWLVLGGGLPNTFVHDLALQERERVLVAATHGRGMWTLRLRRLYSEYSKLHQAGNEDRKAGDAAAETSDEDGAGARPEKGGE